MKTILSYIYIGISVLCFSSCETNDYQGYYLGKSRNYDNFLWSESNWEKDILPEQVLQFDMGDIKFTKPIKLQIVYEDENGEYQPVDKKIMTIFLNGKKDSKVYKYITIHPKDRIVNLKFRFNKSIGKESRTFKLSMKILDPGDLDLVNGQEAKAGAILDTSILWQTDYELGWNPLQTFLMWLGFFIVVFLLLWFLLFRRIIFPTFCFDNLQVIYLEGESKKGREDCSLHGARKIVCSDSAQSQSGINRIFCGRIEYLTNPFWNTSVVMKPCGSNGISINEDVKPGDAATYRMSSMITPQNGPRRPFVVKRVKSELIANIAIG